ncbi:denticleless protein homolog isoform X2 [Hyla sarda]|uniref:denticleless protein homolog isoform X2 n=1 Tax=Hyla sarda TaxID=327740 RepID=UPI0024C25958|nr:denticleless protein homolog isoform X2 [Hyla sarda]
MSLFQRVVNRSLWRHNGSYGFPLQNLLQCFQCSREDEHTSYGEVGMPVPPFGCSFSSVPDMPHVLGVANEEGMVRLYDTECQDMQRRIVKDWQAHTNAVFDIAWVPGEHKLVTASGDQTAKLFDVKAGELLGECKGHQCSLKSVTFSRFEKAVFSTGGRDGNIMVWDTRCNKKDGFYRQVNQITGAHNAPDKRTPLKVKKRKTPAKGLAPCVDFQQSVTVVIFQDEHTIISAGAVDGIIKMWDLRKNYTAYRQDPIPAKCLPYPGNSTRKLGYSSLILDSTGSSLFASCTDDNIYMFNVAGLKSDPVSVFSGHNNSTFYIKSSLSPDGQFLLSGSSDHNAYIWQVSKPYAPPIMLQGHSQEVTSVTWSPTDFTKIVTCSDDNTIRVWRMKRAGSEGMEEEKLNKVGWTCPKKIELPSTVTVLCTPPKSPMVHSPQIMSSPTPATCAPSYTGDLPMSSSTPTSPFVPFSKLHTPKRPKVEVSTTTPKQQSASKVTIKSWVTRTPRSLTLAPKTPSPRKAFTPIEQYAEASDSRAPPTYEKRAKRRLETSSENTEHECFSQCTCVTELEPGMKKTKLDLELCSVDKEDSKGTRCLNLADLSTDCLERPSSSQSIDVPDGRLKSPCLVKSGPQDKENTPEKNWLSALGSKIKSDKSTTHCKVTHSPSSSGSAKKTPARSKMDSPICTPTPRSSRKISMYFKKPTE